MNRLLFAAAVALSTLTVVTASSAGPAAAERIEERAPVLLADLEQNAVGLQLSSIAANDDAVYFNRFAVENGVEVSELWRYDRTTGATEVAFSDPTVRDIRPQAALGGVVFFSAENDDVGSEPWVYDESTGTAQLLYDIVPGAGRSSIADIVLGDRFYMVVRNGPTTELWATKGTPETTERLTNPYPGENWGSLADMTVAQTGPGISALFFVGSTPSTGRELFRFDEGVGFTPIEINAGVDGSSPGDLQVGSDGAVYFIAQVTGTPQVAYRIAAPAAVPGGDVPAELAMGSQTVELVVVDSTVHAVSGGFGARELWRVDGAAATPVLVADPFSGRNLGDAGFGVIFQAPLGGGGTGVGVSDGTAGGTLFDVTLEQPYNYPVPNDAGTGIAFTGEEYGANRGVELWVSSGVPGSTVEVLDIWPGPIGSRPASITAAGKEWFFVANDGVHGQQLWTTDGSAAGTERLTSLDTGLGASSDPREFTGAGDSTYFSTRSPDGYRPLWRHDRTTGEVMAVKSVEGAHMMINGDPIAFAGSLLFAGSEDGDVFETWRSDGTPVGTQRLGAVVTEGEDAWPLWFTPFDDRVVFVAADRLWVAGPETDDLAELSTYELEPRAGIGRKAVAEGCAPDCGIHSIDIDTGAVELLVPGGLLGRTESFGDDLYIVEGNTGALHRTDGTAAGTGEVAGLADIAVGQLAAMPGQLVLTRDRDSVPGLVELELFVLGSDGTARTVQLPDGFAVDELYLEGPLVIGDQLVVAGERYGDAPGGGGMLTIPGAVLVSIAGDQLTEVTVFASEQVLWTGQHEGVSYVLTSGSFGGDERMLTIGEAGPTLWRTDGTTNGTEALVDFGASDLRSYFGATLVDGLLYGGGETPATGFEPFTFDLRLGPDLVSLEPARVLDTRDSGETVDDRFEKIGRVEAGETVEVDIAGRAGVDDDAAAAVLNVTMARPDKNGFVTVFPCGDRPLASSMNASAARTVVANEVIAKLSSSGAVCLYASVGTNLIADVTGYVPGDSRIVSLEPARLLDTRGAGETVDDRFEKVGKVGAGETVELEVLDRGGVPDSGVAAVVLNVTMVRPDGNGFVTVFPCGDQPNASSMNASAAGAVVANELIAKVSPTGTVCLYSSVGTNLVADVTGYVPTGVDAHSLEPARLLDTRASGETVDDRFEKVGKVGAGETVELEVLDRGGVPDSGVAAVVLNVTMVRPDGNGFVTVFPCGDQPNASSMNASAAGAVVANELIAKVSPTGTVCLYSSVGTNLLADVTGFIST